MTGREEQERGGAEGTAGRRGGERRLKEGGSREGRGAEGRDAAPSERLARPASRWGSALGPRLGQARRGRVSCAVLSWAGGRAGLAESRRCAVRRLPGRWPLGCRPLLRLLSHAGLPDCGLRTLSTERTFLSPERVPAPLPASQLLRGAEPGEGAARRGGTQPAGEGPETQGAVGPVAPVAAGARKRARGEHR